MVVVENRRRLVFSAGFLSRCVVALPELVS